MFLTSVSVIIPVVDGHAVKVYTRNGGNTPRSMNLFLKLTWIKVVVKYINFCFGSNSISLQGISTVHSKMSDDLG